MYTYNELNAVELSPTKKDYYQVWNELLDVAGKLSNRWDPSATNESDPGIVLLKVLTAITDKLSYNIDVNTLEAFMPSAAQESSMRKLCEMLGYDMKFYESATTDVRITYQGDVFPDSNITIDPFSNIKDLEGTVNYLTLEPVILNATKRSQVVTCIEGELITCETTAGNRITLEHLDDNYRFYLPERQVAANKIFVSSYSTQNSVYWEQVSNLNTQPLASTVFKFGYDSSMGLPYLEFPEDIGSLIQTGLMIQFIRTKGASGNIATGTLKTLEKPLSWSASTAQSDTVSSAEIVEGAASAAADWQDVTLYTVTNIAAARDGKDPETIDEAYWGFQKTIGTFDTLVTCRDYMNKIYQMTKSSLSSDPLVSNIIVSDIRDDINRAYSISTLTDRGQEYSYETHKDDLGQPKINYFDLVLYPFVATNGLNTQSEYEASFTYTDRHTAEIIEKLQESKTIAHNFVYPTADEIACIKIYFQLSARLNTTSKVTALEAAEIELAAHRALYKDFNSHNMTFGDELPFDLILKTLTNADSKIKNVSLDDPKLYVSICTVSGKEFPLTGDYVYTKQSEAEQARKYYLDLVLRNVLAGKISLLEYDTTFTPRLDCVTYPASSANATTTASKLLPTETGIQLSTGATDTNKKLSILSTATEPGLLNQDLSSKALAYTNTNTGICTLKLCTKEPDGSQIKRADFSKVIGNIKVLTLDLYTPGSETPVYKIEYIPQLNAAGTAFRLDAQLFEASLPVTSFDFYTASGLEAPANVTVIENSESYEVPDLLDLTLCKLPFNNRASKNVIDKVVVNLTPALDTTGSDLVNSAVVALTYFDFSWDDTSNTTVSESDSTNSTNLLESGAIAIKTPVTLFTCGPTTETSKGDSATLELKLPEDVSITLGEAFPYRFFLKSYEKGIDPVGIHESDYFPTRYSLSCNTTEGSPNTYKIIQGGIAQGGREICVVEAEVSGSDFTYTCTIGANTPISVKHSMDSYTDYELAFEYLGSNNYSLKRMFTKTVASANEDTVEKSEPVTILEAQVSHFGCLIKLPEYNESESYFINTSWAEQDYFKDIFFIDITDKKTATFSKLSRATALETANQDLANLSTSIPLGNLKLNLASDGITCAVLYCEDLGLYDSGVKDPFTIKNTITKLIPDAVEMPTFLAKGEAYVTVDQESLQNGDLKLTPKQNLPAPTKMTGEFMIDTSCISPDNPLILKQNEVLQFRAPSFKTTKTYPAYVNYFAKLNDASTGGTGVGKRTVATPATLYTLTEFFNGGISGYSETSEWNKEKSWNEKLASLLAIDSENSDNSSSSSGAASDSSSAGTSGSSSSSAGAGSGSTDSGTAATATNSRFIAECFTTPSDDILAGSPEEITANLEYNRNVKKYGALLTKDVRVYYTSTKLKGDKAEAQFDWNQPGYHVFRPECEGNPNIKCLIPPDITFYAIKLSNTNFTAFNQWLQGTLGNITYRADAASHPGKQPPVIGKEKAIKGVYSMGRSNTSKAPGYMVDANHCTFSLISSAPSDPNFDEIYVPRLWTSDLIGSHTADGMGADASIKGITANTEYELKQGEYILFSYSSSEDREDGTAVLKNVAYDAGTIIKANFELIDSTQLATMSPYTKTSDFGPWTLPKSKQIITSKDTAGPIAGMFALSASDQIEIRERIKVEIKDTTACLYWEFNNQSRDADGYEHFIRPGETYTLQAGEYVYYTDTAQESMAYYGFGSEIVVDPTVPVIKRHYSQSTISAEQINQLGLVSAIPWTTVTLPSRAGITVYEYQYINLIEGDTLDSITLDSGVTTSSTWLKDSFQKITGATYKTAGMGDSAPLPPFSISDCYWQARGKLELLMNQDTPQVLNVHQTATGREYARDLIYLWGYEGGQEMKTQTFTPLAFDAVELANSDTTPKLPEDTSSTERTPDLSIWINAEGIPCYEDDAGEKVPVASPADDDFAANAWQPKFGMKLNSAMNYVFTPEATTSYPVTVCSYDAESSGIFNAVLGELVSDNQTYIVKADSSLAYPIVVKEDGTVPGIGFYLNLYIVVPEDTTSTLQLGTSGKVAQPLAVFSSIDVLGTTGTISFLANQTSGVLKDVSFKACKLDPVQLSNGQTFTLTTNSTTGTTLALGSDHADASLPLISTSLMMPENSFTLFPIYYSPASTDEEADYLKLTTRDEQGEAVNLAIFNNYPANSSNYADWQWWQESTTGVYTLKSGLNTVVIPQSCKLAVYAPVNTGAILVFGEPRIINRNKVLNTKLAFGTSGVVFKLTEAAIAEVDAETQDLVELKAELRVAEAELQELLNAESFDNEHFTAVINRIREAKQRIAQKTANIETTEYAEATVAGTTYKGLYVNDAMVFKRIKELDPEFKYNVAGYISSAASLDLNDLDPSDTLAVASNWFDPQSLNTKFVISEIDTDYLLDHVVVSKTSRS